MQIGGREWSLPLFHTFHTNSLKGYVCARGATLRLALSLPPENQREMREMALCPRSVYRFPFHTTVGNRCETGCEMGGLS